MADTKITALAAIGANPINVATFPIPMVDLLDTSMAASGTTKKVTVNQILGAGGTATLASATITGDLTVDTSTLKVTASTDTVTVGATTTDAKFRVIDASYNGLRIGFLPGTANYNLYDATVHEFRTANVTPQQLYTLQASSSVWYDGAGGTRMTLNSTGLGVGMTPASSQSRVQIYQALGTTVNGALHITDNATTSFLFNNTSSGVSSIWTSGILTFSTGSNAYSTNGARMTLDASGNLLVGTTSNAPAGTQSQFVNEWSGGAKWGSTFNQTVSSATAYTHIAFCTNGTVRGSIDANNTTITYGTVSDYRLKENVQPISNALTRIAALKPSTYKWKDSGTDGEGFIAHELAAVVPLAVVGQKDAVNEDGSIKAQQIDLSKVVPILVAAIKELAAEVNALKNA
jgi:hypothetical protein